MVRCHNKSLSLEPYFQEKFNKFYSQKFFALFILHGFRDNFLRVCAYETERLRVGTKYAHKVYQSF